MKILVFNKEDINFSDFGSHTIFVISSVDLIIFKKYCRKKHYKPYRVYSVFNVNNKYLELFAYYLKYKYYKYYQFSPSLKLILQWEKILYYYNNLNYVEALHFLHDIKTIHILLNIDYLKMNLIKFINNITLPFYESGVYLKKNLHLTVHHDTWLNHDFDYLTSIQSYNFHDPKWHIFNIYINNLVNTNNLFSDNLANKLFSLSLFFYKTALYFYKNGNYTLAYTLLHRSLDTFYQYKCRQTNTSLRLCVSSGKLKYHPVPTNRWEQMVVLKNSETCLNNNSVMTPPFFNLQSFNDRRNKLYLTHGIFTVKKHEVLQTIKNIKKCIDSIDGTNWFNQVRNIMSSHKLKQLDLFMYEPSFESYLKDITSEFNF